VVNATVSESAVTRFLGDEMRWCAAYLDKSLCR
jgi:hypothetical protein